MIRSHLLTLLMSFSFLSLQGQAWAVNRSVMLHAQLNESPPSITLQWANDDAGATGFQVYRRSIGEASWGPVLASLPAGSVSFTDADVLPGHYYEYQVIKSGAGYTGYGYLLSGIRTNEVEGRGICILVVDKTHAEALESEIGRLISDMEGDGWIVRRMDVMPEDAVP